MEYAAYDAQGKLAGKEAVGQPLHLPPGMYTIVVRASRPVNVAGVKVASNETATYMVQRTGADWSVTAEGKR